MKVVLSRLLRTLVPAAISLAMTGAAVAQQAAAWPTKPIKIIGAFPAGVAPDILGRAIIPKLSERLGQPIVLENKPGANTIIGMQACAAAATDGHTFCLTTNDSFSLNPHLFKSLPYDADKGFLPVAVWGYPNSVIVVNSALGVKNFAELVALGKAKPGTLNWASFGMGSSSHLYLEWLRDRSGLDAAHVPFNNTAMIQAVVANQSQLLYFSIGGVKQHIDSGKLTPLLVAGDQRSPYLPNVPTFAEAGIPKFLVQTWFGLFAPAGTPPDVVTKLNELSVAITNDPAFRSTVMTNLTMTPSKETPEQIRTFMQKDRQTGAELVRIAKVKLD